MSLQCMTPGEIQDITNRLRQLNDTVQKMSQSAQSGSDSSAEKVKADMEAKMKEELSEVADTIQTKLIPPMTMATQQLSMYQQLMKIPPEINTCIDTDTHGKPIKDPYTYQYLTMVASMLYAPNIAKLSALVSSVAEPMARLNAELQKASSLTVQISPSSGETSVNAPQVSK